MTPARWRDVTRVYAAVVGRDPAARGEALAAACGNDEELRREVEALLAEDAGATILDRRLSETAAAVGLRDLTGRLLGPYRLEAPIGAGGMGQVYRATDTRLQRTVAIKILPVELSGDPQFRARFDREAKAIAALNDPRICALYDVGSDAGLDFIVLEHLEGETLAARLERGPLPLAQALQTAIEIAEALAAAHRHGIVHRDLKPGNVMLTKGGVKLLDFGLAKTQPAAAFPQLSMMPTTPPNLTAQGTILGTFQFMAPEQLEGREADARTDIFAFGATAYEMFTGTGAFEGKSQASIIAAIMNAEPAPMTSVQPLTPPALDRIVRTCLAKAPHDRWQSARDLKRELQWIRETEPRSSPVQTSTIRRLSWIAVAAAGASALALVALLWIQPWRSRPAAMPRVSRLAIPTQAADALWTGSPAPSVALTPDGSRVIYIARNGTVLLARALDSLDSVSLTTGTNIRNPVVSPDGRWVAFWDSGLLKRVSIDGGSSIAIGPRQYGGTRGAVWMADNTLVFATNDDSIGLARVTATGGDAQPEVLTVPDKKNGEADHVYPSALPDGSGILFTITARTGGLDSAVIALYDLRTKTIKKLVTGGSDGQYVASGHILYAAAGTLRAVPFDLGRHETRGAPVPVVDGVRMSGTGSADYALAADGTLVYVPGSPQASGPPRTLVWVDRNGREEPLNVPVRSYAEPRISPDGTRIAVDCADQQNDIWIIDTRRSSFDRMTSEASVEQSPIWTKDGTSVIFTSDRGPVSGYFNVWSQRFDGVDVPRRLTTNSKVQQFPVALLPDGTELLVRETSPDGGRSLMMVALDGTGREAPVIQRGSLRTQNGEVSPDGRWLAFDSDSSGRSEIYVRPYPNVDARQWPVSTAGGTRPHWVRAGKELFFVGLDGSLMRVDVDAAGGWNASAPSRVLPGSYYFGDVNARFDGRHYDVSADGQRFLMIKPVGEVSSPPMLVVQQFADVLRQRVPRSDK